MATDTDERADPPPIQIVVVDDNPIDRGVAAALIHRDLGWDVICAPDGIQALQAMRQHPPAIVLTDLQMPLMNGLELVDVIRREFPLTPVVLMTAYGSEKTALEALRSGAASYVPKSSIDQDLTATLEQVLGAARQEYETKEVDRRLVHAQYNFVLENDPALVRGLVARLKQHLRDLLRFTSSDEMRIGIALEEALLNALYHGNLEVSSDLKLNGDAPFFRLARERRSATPYQSRRIHVTAEYSPDSAIFVIRDEGPGFDVATLPDPTDPDNLCKPCGRGTMLIRTFMDEVSYNLTGNQIRLRKRKDAST